MSRKSNSLMMFGALVCAVLVTSCNVNDDIEDNNAVRFTAGIGQQATPQDDAAGTRAASTNWAAGDAIGIFMVDHTSGDVVMNAANKQYTTLAGGSNFTAVAGEIYYPQTGKVDFIAYYPWKTGYTLGTAIDVEIATTQTAGNQPEFDLLYATADNSGSGYDKVTNANDNVALAFDHKLAKIVMNCEGDPSIGALPAGMTVSITGMNTKNTFDLATGSLGTSPGTPAAITPLKIATAATFDASYDAIIMPGRYGADDIKVTFTVNGDAFTWNVPAITFAGGLEYIYTITVTRTGVKFTGTINPWIQVPGGPGIAE